MLQDAISPPSEDLQIDGLCSPTASQILDFCEEGNLFLETFTSSGVSSCTGGAGGGGTGIYCCDDISSSLLNSQPLPDNHEQSRGYDIGTNFPPSPPNPQPVTLLPEQQDRADQIVQDLIINGCNVYSQCPPNLSLPSIYDEGRFLPGNQAFPGLDVLTSQSCSFLDPGIGACYQSGPSGLPASGQEQEYFPGSALAIGRETGLLLQELVGDCQNAESVSSAVHVPEYIQPSYSSSKIQMVGDEQHLAVSCNSSTSQVSVVPTLDESPVKVGRISVEERKEKIQRYMKKRNERNFNKKIKYACRKTLADSRPRVRGRFAKNCELGVAARPSTSRFEYEEEVMTKEEEDALGSSDILAQISGLNSFQYNCNLDSWLGSALYN